MDDELGSFFAEIEEVEKIHSDELSNKRKNDDASEEISKEKKLKLDENSSSSSSVSSTTVSISSKPISYVAASSQPVKYNNPSTSSVSSAPSLSTTLSNSNSAPPSSSLVPSNPPPPSTLAPPSSSEHKAFVRKAAGTVWVDNTLSEWPENDFRIFVGNLGKEITTDHLTKHFQPLYKSFAMAKVIREGPDNKSKGFGFVSFLDSMDCLKAMKEQNNKYIGSR